MALLMIAASLVMAGCNKKEDDNQERPEETESGKPIQYSRDSLYAYTLNDNNEATLVTYLGNAANVVLNRIDGKQKIVAIDAGAFAGNTSVKNVEIISPVKSIGEGAFLSCTALETVTFRSPVLETIGESAFSGCESLADENGYVIVRDVLYNYTKKDSDFHKQESLQSL